MGVYQLLVFLHVTCFAIWFGSVVVSLMLIRVLEERLTDPQRAAQFSDFLGSYIRLETKVVDVAFLGVAVTGVIMAQFFAGWSPWTIGKLALYVAQFGLTLWYIGARIRPLRYPCSRLEYRRWYELFAVSLGLFAVVLLWTFFGRAL